MLCCFEYSIHTHTLARSHTHSCTQSHVDCSHACICCQLSQTVGNPPPLKQKDLFLSCYRQKHTHTKVSVVFSVETKNITLIPTDLFFTGVQNSRSDYDTYEHLHVAQKIRRAESMNVLIEIAEAAAIFHGLYLESGSHPGAVLIYK